MGEPTPSREAYQYALELYQSFAGTAGMLGCQSGLARLALAEGENPAFIEHKAKMSHLIMDVAPNLDYYLLLLEVYQLQMVKDYAGISRLAVSRDYYPDEVKLQLATAKMQADCYQNQATGESASSLISQAKRYEKLLKKAKAQDSELLSSSWYALAYYHFGLKNYNAANNYLAKVCQIDYSYGNLNALGHALWLKGQVAKALGDNASALSLFIQAEGIFSATHDNNAETTLQAEIQQLRGIANAPNWYY